MAQQRKLGLPPLPSVKPPAAKVRRRHSSSYRSVAPIAFYAPGGGVSSQSEILEIVYECL